MDYEDILSRWFLLDYSIQFPVDELRQLANLIEEGKVMISKIEYGLPDKNKKATIYMEIHETPPGMKPPQYEKWLAERK